jgi:serine protease Do
VNAAVGLLGRVLPATVQLTARVPGEHVSASLLGVERMGTGFLVDPAGLVLTVNYVVVGASSVTVRLLDGREFPAEVVKHDFDSGLAVVRIPATELPHAALGSSATVALGEPVFLVASVGDDQARVGDGMVTYLGPFDANWEYSLDRCIMTSAMNPGLGGGPVFDRFGSAVGVVSLNMNEIGRFAMAVPAECFAERRAQFLDGGGPAMGTRAWLGVFCYTLDDRLVIAGVMPGAPGERAGLRPGDIVEAIDDRPIRERRTLYRLLAQREPGAAFTMSVRRNGRLEQVRVTSGDVVEYFA